MSALQLTLFDALEPAAPAPWKPEDDYPGWESRLLRELAERHMVACYPGFTGARLEALVSRGHASRQDAGFLEHTPFYEGMYLGDRVATPVSYARWCRAQEPAPQFRYEITDAGRALLSAKEPI